MDDEGRSKELPSEKFTSRLNTAQLEQLSWSPHRRMAARVVQSLAADCFMAVILLFNVMLVIHETNVRAMKERPPNWLMISARILLCVYGMDVMLRLYVFRREYFRSNMNILDIVVVCLDIVTEVASDVFGDLPSFSLLRLLRVVRLLRALRVLTAFKELYMMLYGLAGALKAVLWASVLVVLVLAFWSIVSVEILHPLVQEAADLGAFKGCDRCPHAFESVSMALLTFIQTIIAGDSWGQVAIPVMEEHPFSGLIFVSVMVTINFGMLNLVLSVIVDRAQAARDEDLAHQASEKSVEYAKWRLQLKTIFEDMDTDDDGHITYRELMAHFENDELFRNTMQVMDVSANDIAVVFNILDADSSGHVSYDEFAEEFHKMKTQDSHTLLVFMRYYLNDVWRKVNEEISLLKDDLRTRRDLADARSAAAETGAYVDASSNSAQGAGNPGMVSSGASLENSTSHEQASDKISCKLLTLPTVMEPKAASPELKSASCLEDASPALHAFQKYVEEVEGRAPQKYVDDDMARRLADVAVKIEQQVAVLVSGLRGLPSRRNQDHDREAFLADVQAGRSEVLQTRQNSESRYGSCHDLSGTAFEAPLPPELKDHQTPTVLSRFCVCKDVTRPGARSQHIHMQSPPT